MGLLDEIVKQAGGAALGGASGGAGKESGLGSIADLVMRNPQVVSAVLSMLNPKDGSVGGSGGLAEIAGAFQKGGLGDVLGSWVGTGANQPINPGALANVLGPDVLGEFAKKAGIGSADAGSVLAGILPEIVNQMTPQGQLPQGNQLDGVLGSLLSQLGGR